MGYIHMIYQNAHLFCQIMNYYIYTLFVTSILFYLSKHIYKENCKSLFFHVFFTIFWKHLY